MREYTSWVVDPFATSASHHGFIELNHANIHCWLVCLKVDVFSTFERSAHRWAELFL